MARRPKARAMIAKARGTATTPLQLADTKLERLAGRFAEVRSQSYRYLVDASRDAGDVLVQARRLLPDPYDFNRWRETLDVSRASAANFLNVAALAHHAPAIYERWRGLGPSKIYRLARLSPRARDAVLAKPGIEAMNDAAFALLCFPHEESPDNVTPNMLGNGLVQKTLGMRRKLDDWELPPITSDEVRKNLKQGLLELARKARALAGQL